MDTRHLPSAQFRSGRLRRHFSLIFLITAMSGVLFGHIFIRLGITSLVIRNAIVLLLTYCFFFFCISIWRRNLSTDLVSESEYELELMRAGQSEEQGGARKRARSWPDASWIDFGEATIILIVMIALIWTLVWIFGEAPAIMSEALLDIGMTASIAGALRKRRGSPWYTALFRKTALAFTVFYFSSIFLLAVVTKSCPEQPTLSKVVRACWMHSSL